MAIAVAVALLVLGSVLFHFLSPWYFLPIASNWVDIDNTIAITFWVTGSVFVAVNLFMVYCVIRYRRREGSRAAYEPEKPKLEAWLIALTTVGVVAMLAPGLLAWAKVITVPKEATVFEAVGRQWHWSYRFPGRDGVLGTVDARHVTDENPFGVNPADTKGLDDILISSPEVHLQAGRPVKVLLRSLDVLHNFAVPQFRVKMDLVPGMVTYLWFTPTRKGTFDLLCEELCGLAHFTMRGKVVVDDELDFKAWLGTHQTFAQSQAGFKMAGDPAAGKKLYASCASCHGLSGEGNATLHTPKIAGQAGWYLKRQLINFMAGARGTHPKDQYGALMAPMARTLGNERGIDHVVSYLATLPDNPAPATLRIDTRAGQALYSENCAACHGADGQGIKAMNAPRIAGVNDWYLITQLRNFEQRIRGAHAKDMYGPQMVSMAAILTDDQSRNDLVAYVNSLKTSKATPHAESRLSQPVAKRVP